MSKVVKDHDDLQTHSMVKNTISKGGFKSEGRGGFSQLPKMSTWDLENENSDSFLRLQV